jgi:hypothetical protein
VHYLDFKGRVTKLSMKNFQLVHWDHNSNQLGNDLVMQFGKRGHDEYALDFCYPLSLLQAFALGGWWHNAQRCIALHTSALYQHDAMQRLRRALLVVWCGTTYYASGALCGTTPHHQQ